EHRPRAERQEERAGAEPHEGDRAHQHEKAGAAERAVRREQRPEDRFVRGFGFGHGREYRGPMRKPKSKTAAPVEKPRLRDGSLAKPRPRPQRPPATLYSPQEVEEIF